MKSVAKILTLVLALGLVMSFTLKNDNDMNNNPKEDPKKELAHFPEAKEGMVRYVIFLNKKSNEDLYKVELIPGKVMNVDCNIHRLMGNLEEKDLEGWGYTYFDFSSNGETASTLMGCLNQPNTDKFISAQSVTVRYNSKLPIVIYAPKGYEVKYRIWKAGKEQIASEN